MSRPRASLGLLPNDLYIEPEPWPRIGRPPEHDVEAWAVTDDWPDPVPITDAELDAFEAWFGTSRERIRIDGGGYRRAHLRALAQRVEVADREVRIIGSKSTLLQTLTAAACVKPATSGVRSSVLIWRTLRDSNSRPLPSEGSRSCTTKFYRAG
jgi:hypothetical protein